MTADSELEVDEVVGGLSDEDKHSDGVQRPCGGLNGEVPHGVFQARFEVAFGQ